MTAENLSNTDLIAHERLLTERQRERAEAAEARVRELEDALREIASYVDGGDRNDDIVSGYALAKIAREALAEKETT